ncbi:MAG: type III pantothenate kinase [Chlorobium sp.]|jgi:type III pantothenate kinase|nr:type III pantothenate kinase [Chlorobium sp.]
MSASVPVSLLLVVEIGNTTTSFVVLDGDECLVVKSLLTAALDEAGLVSGIFSELRGAFKELKDVVVCSVVPAAARVIQRHLQKRLAGLFFSVTSSITLPFTLDYDIPESFGADRLALCALSRYRYPDRAVIALDIGTALTFDVLGSNGDYLGGLIMPGLEMRSRALHERTAQLPLVGIERSATLIGRSTKECIMNGIFWGCVSEIEGLISKIERHVQETYGEERPVVIATGGSAPLIAGLLDSLTLHDEYAVIRGAGYLFRLNRPTLF